MEVMFSNDTIEIRSTRSGEKGLSEETQAFVQKISAVIDAGVVCSMDRLSDEAHAAISELIDRFPEEVVAERPRDFFAEVKQILSTFEPPMPDTSFIANINAANPNEEAVGTINCKHWVCARILASRYDFPHSAIEATRMRVRRGTPEEAQIMGTSSVKAIQEFYLPHFGLPLFIIPIGDLGYTCPSSQGWG
jgi:hypothetical protein